LVVVDVVDVDEDDELAPLLAFCAAVMSSRASLIFY
jgi:hypothetical protein